MMSMKPPYNVNLAAEIALVTSLMDRTTLMTRVNNIVQERARLMVLLNDIPGVTPHPSQANFILTQLPEGRGREIFEGLCSKGIFLRYFGKPPLTDFVRVSVGLPHENDIVVKTLKELVGE
jgi:histidinol-phosphate aminotransferase